MTVSRAVDVKILRLFAVLAGHPPAVVLALDPGTHSSGWALSLKGMLYSGQGEPEIVAETILKLLKQAGVVEIDVLVVEEPFFVGKGNQWKLPWSGGYLEGRFIDRLRKGGVLWKPKASTWRGIIGINKGVDGSRKGPSVNLAVHAWAAKTVGLSLVTEGGKREEDRANAIGMLKTALALARSVKAPA